MTEQKNPKFLQIIKTIFGEQPSPLVWIVQIFFTAGFDSAIMIPYVYVIVYPLEKWFARYFELALSTKLCAISLFRSRLVIG